MHNEGSFPESLRCHSFSLKLDESHNFSYLINECVLESFYHTFNVENNNFLIMKKTSLLLPEHQQILTIKNKKVKNQKGVNNGALSTGIVDLSMVFFSVTRGLPLMVVLSKAFSK